MLYLNAIGKNAAYVAFFLGTTAGEGDKDIVNILLLLGVVVLKRSVLVTVAMSFFLMSSHS